MSFFLLSLLVAIYFVISHLIQPKYIPRHKKQAYLKSRAWASLRRLTLQRDSYTCQLCNSQHIPLEIHHISYKEFGNESLSDLVTLCRPCHQSIHDKYGYTHTRQYPIK